MLKEARIVMPIVHNGSHDKLQDGLLRAFGDFTSFRGAGQWYADGKTHYDEVMIYDVAIDAERDASWDKLFQIAMTAGRELGQESVYIRYPDGSVCIEPVAGRGGLGALMPDNSPRMAPLGAKRLPQVGEVWRNGVGQLVAVAKTFTKIDSGYECLTLTLGDSGAANVGYHYDVDLDGKVLPDKSSHPRDLKTYITRFDS